MSKKIKVALAKFEKAREKIAEYIKSNDLRVRGFHIEANPKRRKRTGIKIIHRSHPEMKELDRKVEQQTIHAAENLSITTNGLLQAAQSIGSLTKSLEEHKRQLKELRENSIPLLIERFDTQTKKFEAARNLEQEHHNTRKRILQEAKTKKRSGSLPAATKHDRPQEKITMSKKGKENEMATLLKDLAASEDQGEKRKIRARLRSLGHAGGLGNGKAKKVKKTKKVKKVKKVKKAKRAKRANKKSS